MSLLPPPGPQRNRQLTLLAVLGVALIVLLWRAPWRTANPAVAPPPAPGQVPAVVQQARAAGGAGTVKAPTVPSMPVPVNLDKLEPVPDEPGSGRNLFRFGMRPAPPPPPPPPPPPVAPIVQGPPPPPPGPPPIELQLKGIYRQSADTPAVAYLKDPKAPADARMLSGSEGQIVDGRYKLVKVGTESVIVSYIDGTGQRTIMISRQ